MCGRGGFQTHPDKTGPWLTEIVRAWQRNYYEHMRIALINPGQLSDAGEDQFAGRMDTVFFRLTPFSKTYFGIPLALPTLAGATPSKHSVRIIDEMVETIDFDAPCDVVGISAMTCKATRGYQIAVEFRKRGVPVIMGGIHASMCPDEVAAHVDCVVVGEADAIWAEILHDLEQGQLKPRYCGALPDAASIALPRHDLTPHEHYFAYLLQTTRGCPRDCSFCTVTAMNGRTLRKKTPEQVMAEVRSVLRIPNQVRPVIFDIEASKRERRLASGTIFFVDDNFAIDRQHALSICRALKDFQDANDVHINWFTQTDFRVGFDDELLSAMKDAGCMNIFVGFESLSPQTLKAMKKNVNSPERYAECIQGIESHGIAVTASVIVGADSDTLATEDEMAEFVLRNRLFYFFPNILTPYPGTRLAQELQAAQRILIRAPELYNVRNVVFQPKQMTPRQLRELYVSLCQKVLGIDNLHRSALEKLKRPNRYYLTRRWRLLACLGFSWVLVALALKRTITLRELVKLLWWAPKMIIADGSLIAMGLVANLVSFCTFSRSEARRLGKEPARLCDNEHTCRTPREL